MAKDKSGLGGYSGMTIFSPSSTRVMSQNNDNDNDQDDEKIDMKCAGDFFGRLLISVPMIHMLHLQAMTFPYHIALDELYKDLPDDIDTIVEEFQGRNGVIDSYQQYVSFNPNAIAFLTDLVEYIEDERYCIGKASSLQANVDEIVTDIYGALYKMKNLK